MLNRNFFQIVARGPIFLALFSLFYSPAGAGEHPLFGSWHLETEELAGAESAGELMFRIEAEAFSVWHAGKQTSVRNIRTWEEVPGDDSGTLRLIFTPKEFLEVSWAGSTNRLRCTANAHSETNAFMLLRGPPGGWIEEATTPEWAKSMEPEVKIADTLRELLIATLGFAKKNHGAMPAMLSDLYPHFGEDFVVRLRHPITGEFPGYVYQKPAMWLRDVAAGSELFFERRNGEVYASGLRVNMMGRVSARSQSVVEHRVKVTPTRPKKPDAVANPADQE